MNSKDKIEDKEITYANDIPLLMIMNITNILNDFIIIFSNFLRQDDDINNNFIFAFLNQELIQFFMKW